MRLCECVPATHYATQGRQDTCVLATGTFGALRAQSGAADRSATGELDNEGCARAENLAQEITGRAARDHQKQLFEDIEWTEPLRLKLDEVRLERSRSFGAVWLGWVLWRAL